MYWAVSYNAYGWVPHGTMRFVNIYPQENSFSTDLRWIECTIVQVSSAKLAYACYNVMQWSGKPDHCIIYANSEPQPNAKYSCAASIAIAR